MAAKRKTKSKRPAGMRLLRKVSKSRLVSGRPSKKSKPKPSRQLSIQPAQWFRDSVHRGWANDSQAIEYAKRQSEVDYLRESIKLLRRFYTGFTPSDGYSLKTHELVRLDKKRHAKISSLAAQLRKEMSAGFDIVRPRSRRSKEALYKHTGASRSKQRKAFVVHTPDKNTDIKLDYPSNAHYPVHVKEVSKRTGAESRRVYYYFVDYLEDGEDPPQTMEEILDVTTRMIPTMRKGYYVFVSRDFGYISDFIFRDHIEQELSSRWLVYDVIPGTGQKDNRGLADNLIGFALVSTKIEGAKYEYRERQTRRFKYRQFKEAQRRAKRVRIRKRLR